MQFSAPGLDVFLFLLKSSTYDAPATTVIGCVSSVRVAVGHSSLLTITSRDRLSFEIFSFEKKYALKVIETSS